MDPQINSYMFSYIFHRANIFSCPDFLPTIFFTSHGYLWRCLSNQGDLNYINLLSRISQTGGITDLSLSNVPWYYHG